MNIFRKLTVLAIIGAMALTARASCEDIKAACSRAFKLDLEYCNKQSPQSQENCFKRAHEALASCMQNCK